VTREDLESLHGLLQEFDVGFNDLAAPTDIAMREAVRKIAEQGSGLPHSGWALSPPAAVQFSENGHPFSFGSSVRDQGSTPPPSRPQFV
jgi:hypothetical protein